MLRGVARLWFLAMVAVVAVTVSLLQPVDAASAQDPVSPALSVPLLESEPPAPITPETPEGEAGLDPLPLAEPVEELAAPEVLPESPDASALSGADVVERDLFTTTYQEGGGSLVRHMSLEPLNAEVDGAWVEIDTSIESAGSGWEVAAHPLAPAFASDAASDATVSLQIDDTEVSYGLEGASAGDVSVPFWWWDAQNELTYRDVLDGADLAYEVTPGQVKETLVLDALPADGRTSWSWRLDAGGLSPRLTEHGALELTDAAGDVVASSETPIAWDSSGTGDRWRSESVLEPSLEEQPDGSWRYALTVDAEWLGSQERVWPVSIDPSINPGPLWSNAYKSDGTVQSGVVNVGNTREGGYDRYWRSTFAFDYGDAPGRIIEAANIGVGYVSGTTTSQSGTVNYASCSSYTCTGTVADTYTLSNGDAFTTGDGVAQTLVDRFEAGDSRPGWMIRGNERAGLYTYKRVNVDVWVRYHTPSNLYNSATSGTLYEGQNAVSETPTLRARLVMHPSGHGGTYAQHRLQFEIATDRSFSDRAVVHRSDPVDYTASAYPEYTVPAGVLQPGTGYYWRATASDGYHGRFGQSTRLYSSSWGFRTEFVPQTAASSASPGTSSGAHGVATTLTPELRVGAVADTDGTGGATQYQFRLGSGGDVRPGGADGNGSSTAGAVVRSGWLSPGADGQVRWRVPEGSLEDGGTYTWTVLTRDSMFENPTSTWVLRLRTDLRLGSSGPSPFDAAGPVSVNLANGNAALSFASPTVDTVGGPMGYGFSYNSQEAPDANRGLRGEYFDARVPEGQTQPNQPGDYDIDAAEPALVRTDPSISFDWRKSSPPEAVGADNFMARWSGFVTLPADWAGQPVEFGVLRDDGVRLWVDEQRLLNHWSWTSPRYDWASAAVTLPGEQVPIRLEFLEGTGSAAVQLWIRKTSDRKESAIIVPPDWFTRELQVLPAGWSSSAPIAGAAGRWSSATATDSSVILTDTSGRTVTFRSSGERGYAPPPGEWAHVAKDEEGRVTVVDEDGTVTHFTPAGRLESVTAAQDARRPAAPQTRLGEDGRVLALVDPLSASGEDHLRGIDLAYGGDGSTCADAEAPYAEAPAGMLCGLAYPDGTATQLLYDEHGRLRGILDPGNELTQFGYDDDGRMVTIRDSVANDAIQAGMAETDASTTQLTYTNGRVSRVDLPSPAGTSTTDRPGRSYTYAAGTGGAGTTGVTVHGLAGVDRTVGYDSAWRHTTSTSNLGVTSSQVWRGEQDLLRRTVDAAGRVSTTVYDAATDRAVAAYGPAPAACFGTNDRPVANPAGTAGCGLVPGHTATGYDGALTGLQAAFYDNADLSGQPAAFALGIGGTGGAVTKDWGAGSPEGVASTDRWSARLTGLITFPAAGQYTLSAVSDDGVRIWVDDLPVISDWYGGAKTRTAPQAITATAGQVSRIRVEYWDSRLDAHLHLRWSVGGAAAVTIPGSALRPDYGLATTTTVTDQAPAGLTDVAAPTTTATFAYQHPWLGQATSSSIAGLTTRLSFEAPGAESLLRRTERRLPAANTSDAPAGAGTATHYYGELEHGPAVCGIPAGTPQYGMAQTIQGPIAADGSRVTTHYVYDEWGRAAGTKIDGDTGWSCTTYDDRGRVTAQSAAGRTGVPGHTVTTTYTPTAAGMRVATTGRAVAGSPNGSTVTTTTDLLGRVTQYTDVFGTVTVPTYQARTGRLVSTTTTPAGQPAQSTGFVYDRDGKITSVSVNGTVTATPSYDQVAQLTSVAYAGGASLTGIARDGTGRGTGQTWSFPSGGDVTETAARSQSGRILEHVIGQDGQSYRSAYKYDGAGRLVQATIPGHVLSYGFAATGGCGPNTAAGASGNRTSLTDVWTAPGQTARTTTTAYCYDWADRLQSSTVTGPAAGAHAVADGLAPGEIAYDVRGNTTKLADATLRYDAANAHAGTSYADGTVVTIARDATGRVAARTTDPAGSDPAVTVRYLYAGDADEPFAQLEDTTLRRHVELPGGATVTITGGGREWQYPSMLGHTITTGDGTTSSPVQLYDPYGQPLEQGTYALGTIAADDTGTTADRTGWHQAAARIADTAGTVTIIAMGARLSSQPSAASSRPTPSKAASTTTTSGPPTPSARTTPAAPRGGISLCPTHRVSGRTSAGESSVALSPLPPARHFAQPPWASGV
ncbi:hypothetical protein ABA31_14370 [Agrococcus baldri]|uniref:PA14 domain-containing protein n=2 Tax=Agrococcus baldri TaxID=153730 RepID=A0AA87URK4_9MICO|nr:hypothetical protein ABA31_14370 [Agrococcus baldri]